MAKPWFPGGARVGKSLGRTGGRFARQRPAFFEKLLAHDDGWLAAYFDALARINGPVKDYLTDPERLKRFYTAIRGRVTSPGPGASRVPLQHRHAAAHHAPAPGSGRQAAHARRPGRVEKAVRQSSAGQIRRQAEPRRAGAGRIPTTSSKRCSACAAKSVENEPLKIFMALSDVERNRHEAARSRHGGPAGARISRR